MENTSTHGVWRMPFVSIARSANPGSSCLVVELTSQATVWAAPVANTSPVPDTVFVTFARAGNTANKQLSKLQFLQGKNRAASVPKEPTRFILAKALASRAQAESTTSMLAGPVATAGALKRAVKADLGKAAHPRARDYAHDAPPASTQSLSTQAASTRQLACLANTEKVVPTSAMCAQLASTNPTSGATSAPPVPLVRRATSCQAVVRRPKDLALLALSGNSNLRLGNGPRCAKNVRRAHLQTLLAVLHARSALQAGSTVLWEVPAVLGARKGLRHLRKPCTSALCARKASMLLFGVPPAARAALQAVSVPTPKQSAASVPQADSSLLILKPRARIAGVANSLLCSPRHQSSTVTIAQLESTVDPWQLIVVTCASKANLWIL